MINKVNLAIETINLTKKYGSKIGCTDICLRVTRGQIFGFLGPNGAGKSTLIKMLVGLLYPSCGKAFLLGQPLGNLSVKRKIGFLPENFRYHDWLTCSQLLDFHASLYGMSSMDKKRRIPAVLDLVGLAGREHHKIRTYSKGMQQRAGLACALVADPELLFLDEPTSALDPLGRLEVREILINLKALGKTIFLNSHLLSEVEMICDTVAFIKNGRIIHQDSMDNIRYHDTNIQMRISGLSGKILKALQEIALNLTVEGDIIQATVQKEEDIPALAEAVIKNGAKLYELKRRQYSLEETFIHLTGGGEQ